jgi:hypothetical protein
MGTKKGGARKGKPKGSRKAFDDTKDSKKKPSAAASRKKGVTTKKGMARKGTVAGSRLAYDDTEAIRTDQDLKPVKTKIRKRKKGKEDRYGGPRRFAEVKPKGNVFWSSEELQTTDQRIDEGILRLIHSDFVSHGVRPIDLLTRIERLILGKYK